MVLIVSHIQRVESLLVKSSVYKMNRKRVKCLVVDGDNPGLYIISFFKHGPRNDD
jgi:hypothetical protein